MIKRIISGYLCLIICLIGCSGCTSSLESSNKIRFTEDQVKQVLSDNIDVFNEARAILYEREKAWDTITEEEKQKIQKVMDLGVAYINYREEKGAFYFHFTESKDSVYFIELMCMKAYPNAQDGIDYRIKIRGTWEGWLESVHHEALEDGWVLFLYDKKRMES